MEMMGQSKMLLTMLSERSGYLLIIKQGAL